MRKTALLLLLLCAMPLASYAQKDKIHEAKKLYTNLRLSFINLFFGQLSGQYELQLGRSALNLNGSISLAADKKGWLGGLSYRYYFSDRRTSYFIGAIANFSDYKKSYDGVSTVSNTPGTFYLLGQTVNVGMNIGKRWSILRIFNITARLGYGVPIQTKDFTWTDNATPTDSYAFQQKFLFSSGIDGELSFGWHIGR